MARSAFMTNRISSGTYLIEDTSLTTGARYYVHHSGANSASRGQTPDVPVATIDYAIGLCTPNQSDTIYLMPGHAETITTSGAITSDVAGITIKGLGHGANRPTITWGGTAALWLITAASVRIENIRCTCSVDEVVRLFSTSGAHTHLNGVDFFETATFQAIQFLLTNSSATDLIIENCKHYQDTASAADQKWLQLIGTHRALIRKNILQLTLKNSIQSQAIQNTDVTASGIVITKNIITQLGGTTQTTVISALSGTTGFVTDNRVASAITAIAGMLAGDNLYFADNKALNTPNKSGILEPVADT